jgi:multiple sugar transport system substrate-binding protein
MISPRRILAGATTAIALALAAASAQAADFTVWGLQAFNPQADALIGKMVQEFGQKNGIDAEYVVVPANVLNERLASAIEAKTLPDVFMTISQNASIYTSKDLTIPLDDVLADMRKVPGGIYERVVPLGGFAGKIYGLPLEVDVAPLIVRTDLLKQVGMDIPKTWDELRAAAKAIQAKNPMIYGLGLTMSTANDAEGQLRMLMRSFGGQMFSEDGKTVTFDSPETRAAFQFAADMALEDRTIPRAALTWDDAGNNVAYQTGRAAFVINPPSLYGWMKDNNPELLANTAMVNIPKGPGEKGINGGSASTWVWLVAKSSRHQDLAKAWLRTFFEPATYQQVILTVGGRWVPIYKSMAELPLFKDTPQFAHFGEIANGYVDPPSAAASEISAAKIVSNAFQKVVVSGTPVAEATAWAQAEMEKIAAQN